jgi:hypothetical protein
LDCQDEPYSTQSPGSLHKYPRRTPDIIQGGDGRPDIETIRNTYSLFFRYMKITTLDGFNHEKPSPPDVFPNLDFPVLTDPHDDPPGESDHEMDFLDWILAILRFILWIVAIAIWLATILPAILLDIATYGPRLIAYYTIQLPLYYLLKAQRAVMVMTGYLYPMQDEIDLGLVKLGASSQYLYQQNLSAMDDIFGIGNAGVTSSCEEFKDTVYPHQHADDDYHHPWLHPQTPQEQGASYAGPYKLCSLPGVLQGTDLPGSQEIRAKYERARTPQDTDAIGFENAGKDNQHLGDPVHFSSYLIWQLTRNEFRESKWSRIVDWNLDADRGYAYHCWDWDRHEAPAKGEPMDPAHGVLTDLDGHLYLAPCTPPPQAPISTDGCRPAPLEGYDSRVPLALHYLTEPDPGCSEKSKPTLTHVPAKITGVKTAAGGLRRKSDER